jgi:PPOX class probable F420-dependent enzyme
MRGGGRVTSVPDLACSTRETRAAQLAATLTFFGHGVTPPNVPQIPEEYHDLFDRPTIAHVVTLFPDGRPHATPVWIDYDAGEDRLLVNTERGRRKTRNVEQNPTVAVSMTDPDDPYRFISVTGAVDEVTTEGARAHIDELAGRYMDVDKYPNPVETERIVLRIRPDDVLTG